MITDYEVIRKNNKAEWESYSKTVKDKVNNYNERMGDLNMKKETMCRAYENLFAK